MTTNLSPGPTLSPGDIDGLPPELLKELSLNDSDMLDFQIYSLIDKSGGSLCIDKLLIGLFHESGEIYGRKHIATKVYRMTQKGMIFSSDEGKGIYTTIRPEDEL